MTRELDQQELFEHIKQVLQEVMVDVDLRYVTLDTDLKDDLHVDSTMALDVAYSLCRHFKKDVPFERWFVGQRTDGYTIRALTVFLKKHLQD
jgi:acyl carrier protein